MKLKTEANITSIIEITDNDTNEKIYLVEKENNWVTINEEKYKKILNGEDIDGE